MLFEDLNSAIETEEDAIEFALTRRLLPEKRVVCPVCGIGNVVWYRRSYDGPKVPFALRCSRKVCRRKWSVTKNTWFFGSHLTVRQNILLLYCWVNGDIVGDTAELLNVSKSTVVEYYQFCREVCYTIVSNRTKPIGGSNEIVNLTDYQIDRFIDKQHKVITFLEGSNKRLTDCFLIEIHSYTPGVILNLLKKFILPGSILNVDSADLYSKISDHISELSDIQVNYLSSKGVSSVKKCMWRTAKRYTEEEETKSRDFLMFQYLYFHPFEHLSTAEKFERFLIDVAKVYPGPFKKSLAPVVY